MSAPDAERPSSRSVAELEGLVVDPGAYELGSQAWLSRALVSPIAHLGAADLRLLITHGRGLRHLVPAALDALERAPFVAGDHGPGDLLIAVCLIDPDYWVAHVDEIARLRAVLDAADHAVSQLPERDQAHWREELELARERIEHWHAVALITAQPPRDP